MVPANIWFWVGFIAFVLAMLGLDLGVFHRRAHEVGPKEAGIWTAVWVGLALAFAAGLFFVASRHAALTFLTGYVIEEALSVDNIFVMVLIFEYFRVPKSSQHRVLFYGILGALVMRGAFIAVGSALITRFHWILYIFGALLVFTGVRMAWRRDEAFEGENSRIVRALRRILPLSDRYHEASFTIVESGRRLATPLLLVLILVEATDLVFAIDSIPAIFGVTTDPFIVYTSNIFAVMGLRSLYFLLAAVVDRFHLLKYGLAVILTFVGLKMLTEAWIEIDIALSLGIIVAVLAISIIASMVWTGDRGGRAGQGGQGRRRDAR
jgi:tellurite resistance protein TerC